MYVEHIVVVCECMPAYMLKCCMYAWVCLCIHCVHVCIYACAHVCENVCVSIDVCMCVYIDVLHMCICVHVCTCVPLGMCLCVGICVCVCLCVYIKHVCCLGNRGSVALRKQSANGPGRAAFCLPTCGWITRLTCNFTSSTLGLPWLDCKSEPVLTVWNGASKELCLWD